MNKIISLFLFVALFATSFSTFAAWDIYKTGVQINGIYLDAQPTSPSSDFSNYHFGRFSPGGNITLNFAELFTFKNGGDDVCDENRLFYRVYRTCDAAPSFTGLLLPFSCENGGSCFGTTNFGDQRWAANSGANLLAGLTAPGQYVIEIYFESRGTPGVCTTFKYASNTGANYIAYFTLGDTESFTDGEFTTDRVWSGDDAAWQVVNNSDVSGLIGTENIRTQTLRSNSGSAGNHYLSTQIPTWESQQNWYFWVGRRGQAASSTNRVRIWLYADQANLEGGVGSGLDGYYISVGNAGNDPIEFYRVTNGSASLQFTSTSSVFDGLTDYGITFHISRSETGVWTFRSSALPQNFTEAQASATARSCPEVTSTVVHGTFLDNTHAPAANGYFGLIATVTATAGQSVEFDNFRFVAQPPNTQVTFNASSNALVEPNANATTTVAVNIISPSISVGTSVQVVLTSGDAGRLVSYAPQTVSWAPGESGTKNATFTVAANDNCDDIANLNFQLQNVTGGLNSSIAEPSNFTLTITDDDTGYATVVEDNFEDGNSMGWTSFGDGTWGASNIAPSSGLWSIRHNNTGVAGSSHVAINTEATSLSGVTTTWRFNLKHFNRDPSPNNKFLAIIAANNTNFFGSFNGYAIGVDPIISGDPDIVNFYRVNNGVLTSLAATSLDMSTAINEIGFEIIRSETGVWTIRIDPSGDFDNLATEATLTETTHDLLSFFGARFIYSSSNGDKLALDDILITQKGCEEEFFSQVPGGNFNAAIWSDQPVGTAVAITSGRFTRLTIQENAPVTLTANTACGAMSINANAVLNAGVNTLRIFENLVTGTGSNFNAGTSTVVLKGTTAQTILGTGEPSFFNLTVDNDFGTVSLLDTVRVQNQLVLEEGTLQTDGRLILLSTAARTAGIAAIPAGADISGNVTIQRFIPNGSAGYVYVGVAAVPTTNTIEAVWDDDIVTTGVVGSDFPPPYNFVNIYTYNEALPGGRNSGWVPMINTSNAIEVNKGYSLYMGPGAWTTDVTGTIQKGNISIPITFTNSSNSGDGWNLISNIYPSEVDWIALEANSNDVNNYFLYDNNLPGYRSFSANLGVGSAPRYITHSQAFFVKRTASPANQFINFVETAKSATNVAFERSTEEASFARISITRNGQGDEAVLAFHMDATNNYDVAFDAEKLESPVATAPELALVSADNMLLTIDARPMPAEMLEIPVYLDLPAAGDYTISFPETQNIPFGSCLVVEDVVAGQSWALEAGLTFVISVDAPYQGNRMIIRVSPSLELSSANVTCNGQENGVIEINATEGIWNWTVTNELGTTVFTGEGAISFENLGAGLYTVALTNADGICASVEQEVTITEPAPTEYSFESTISSCNSTTGEVIVNIDNPTEYTYWLMDAITEEVVATGQGSQSIFSIAELPANEYLLTIVNACIMVDHPFSTVDENTIFASAALPQTEFSWEEGTTQTITLSVEAYNATQVLWLLDGVVVGEGHSVEYTLSEPGTYVFTAIASNEGCETSVDVTVTGITFITIGLDEENAEAFNVIARDGGALVNIPSGMNIATLRVVNMSGQVIFEKQNVSNADGQLFIPMAAWASGVYNFNLFNTASSMTQSIIRE
jgi:hypothetical protein